MTKPRDITNKVCKDMIGIWRSDLELGQSDTFAILSVIALLETRKAFCRLLDDLSTPPNVLSVPDYVLEVLPADRTYSA